MQSNALVTKSPPTNGSRLHVAIIMDGNGRWAAARGRPRLFGHREGGKTVERIVRAAPGLDIGTLTLYAFSADNWRRPAAEVAALMALFRAELRRQTPVCVRDGVRLGVIGRRDRLPPAVRAAVEAAEAATAAGGVLHLRLAIDYSSRDAILAAALRLAGEPSSSRDAFARLLGGEGDATAPDVDLLIRTGGEKRLSDFLLWESAYAELYFLERMWPEFDAGDLETAVREFHHRERRFGGLAAAGAARAERA
jgi:undecaprenyl diphosphate synthase